MRDRYRYLTTTDPTSLSVALLSKQDTMPLIPPMPLLPAEVTVRRVVKAGDLRPEDGVLLLHGRHMAQELKRLTAETERALPPVAVLAPWLDWDDVALALELGAVTYLLEHQCPSLLAAALVGTSYGAGILDPAIAAEQARLACLAREREVRDGPADAGVTAPPGPPLSPLSPRERQVMDLVAAGRSVRDVAHELVLTDKSVRNYLDRIYRKLGVRSRATAILCWLGHLEPPLPDGR